MCMKKDEASAMSSSRIFRSVGSWGYSRGGMGSITKAMMGCLNDHGGEVKPSSEVANVIVKNGRAIGVMWFW